MRRTPGTPTEKLALLRGIDETSLPHLVADILYFCRSHRSVTVVDGPGDGRRDISSTTPDGAVHLAQCKFHGDVTAAVGARETDELPVALLKFGCKSGLFVTTARLSPQSKREYLNDFPGFELEFWDGLQLVDHVLSSPLLTELWFHDDSVQRRAVSVAVPFIIRRAGDDKPVHTEADPFATPEYSVNFRNVSISAGVFAPSAVRHWCRCSVPNRPGAKIETAFLCTARAVGHSWFRQMAPSLTSATGSCRGRPHVCFRETSPWPKRTGPVGTTLTTTAW